MERVEGPSAKEQIIDISDRKAAEQALRDSEARFAGLADNIAQLALIADADGSITWYNRRWYEFTGCSPAEMLGWGWRTVHHPDYLEDVTVRFRKCIAARQAWEDTFPLRKADGTYRWFLSRAFPVRDEEGRVTRWYGTNTDITEQREAADTLKAHQAEITQLNVRLQRTMAESHHRIKNNLQALAAIIDMQIMSSDEFAPISAFHRLSRHVTALASLHDLLTAQIKTGADSFSAPLSATLERMLPILRAGAGSQEIELEAEHLSVSLDQAAAISLLVNELVTNAIKHGSGRIEIRVALQPGWPSTAERRGGPRVRLSVRDNGAGFPPGFDCATSAHTGLELVESMARYDLNGRILCANHPDGGAEVSVIFPLTRT